MNLFTKIFENAYVCNKDQEIDEEQLYKYNEKFSKQFPKEIVAAMMLIVSNKILCPVLLNDILQANASKLKSIAKEADLNIDVLKDLQTNLKNAKLNYKMLPHFQTKEEFEDLMQGNKVLDDVVLDLKSEKGRNAIVKQYTPLMHKIANSYVGKSGLDKSMLLSSAAMGLVNAMNDYNKPKSVVDAENKSQEEKDVENAQKRLTFKQYAAYKMMHQILYDINNLSRVVRIPQSRYEKIMKDDNYDSKKTFNSVSIDTTDSEGNSKLDRLSDVSVNPNAVRRLEDDKAIKKTMEKIFSIIDDKFSNKNAAVFYKTFGLNGYKEERPVDIAKDLKTTRQNITNINRRIIAFLKETPEAKPLLQFLIDNITEQLIIDNYKNGQQALYEAFITNDLFILLEELTRFNDVDYFNDTIRETLSNYDNHTVNELIESLNDINYVYDNYIGNRRMYVRFLEDVYPTQSFVKKSDMFIINEMESLSKIIADSGIEL